MFHLGHAKVTERLAKSYYWPSLRADCRKVLTDCPVCEIEKQDNNMLMVCFGLALMMLPVHAMPWISKARAKPTRGSKRHWP